MHVLLQPNHQLLRLQLSQSPTQYLEQQPPSLPQHLYQGGVASSQHLRQDSSQPPLQDTKASSSSHSHRVIKDSNPPNQLTSLHLNHQPLNLHHLLPYLLNTRSYRIPLSPSGLSANKLLPILK